MDSRTVRWVVNPDPKQVLHLEDHQYVTASAAAAMVGVHRQTIRRWLQGGEVEGERRGHRFFVNVASLAEKVQPATRGGPRPEDDL